MAAHHTTRRALFAAVPALPAVIASPLLTTEIGAGQSWRLKKRAFIDEVAFLHPNGRLSATRAMAMDLDPDDCTSIQCYCRNDRNREPILFFKAKGRPNVEIVVSATGAYEHGPVL
jgi:hypothetical protein